MAVSFRKKVPAKEGTVYRRYTQNLNVNIVSKQVPQLRCTAFQTLVLDMFQAEAVVRNRNSLHSRKHVLLNKVSNLLAKLQQSVPAVLYLIPIV